MELMIEKTELWNLKLGNRVLIFQEIDTPGKDNCYEVRDAERTLILRIVYSKNQCTITPAGERLRLLEEDVFLLAGFLQKKKEEKPPK